MLNDWLTATAAAAAHCKEIEQKSIVNNNYINEKNKIQWEIKWKKQKKAHTHKLGNNKLNVSEPVCTFSSRFCSFFFFCFLFCSFFLILLPENVLLRIRFDSQERLLRQRAIVVRSLSHLPASNDDGMSFELDCITITTAATEASFAHLFSV